MLVHNRTIDKTGQGDIDVSKNLTETNFVKPVKNERSITGENLYTLHGIGVVCLSAASGTNVNSTARVRATNLEIKIRRRKTYATAHST